MKRIRVTVGCIADRYVSQDRERVVEFFDPVTQQGGLISFFRCEDGKLRIEPYQCDPGVTFRLPKGA